MPLHRPPRPAVASPDCPNLGYLFLCNDPHDPRNHPLLGPKHRREAPLRSHPRRPQHRSLGLPPLPRPRPPRHQTPRRNRLRPPAEIDFVLLTHHGIFVLEVKGGRLKRRKGVWYSVDKNDALHQLPESPFDQASSAMFALQKRIRHHFKNQPQANPLFAYGVLTPDITFDLDSPESDRNLVYDSRDTDKPFTSYINRLAEFARAAEAREKRPALKPEAIEALANYLRGDFDFIPSPELVIDDVRKQLNDLTKEQRIVLDVLQ
ncbi:MAG: NERD domain-containing protein, partial [Deltaproteobacteria bacterium]|nr:NERD domain-containing protein [Deltaproteobacteria bacterium]